MADIQGEVAPGYEPVRDAFAANFEHGGDIGAAVSLYRNGEKVVDLWGGLADRDSGRPWAEDTLQLVYSATKAATATCAHLLAQRGELDLDAPVAEYWPEFAAEGKSAIPVRWLLAHRTGLPAIDNPVSVPEALSWAPVTEALAAQRPWWEPGTAFGYHGRTFGWLVGEVIRRVSGRSVGRFLADEITGPLGLDFHIGLPETEQHRVSRMVTENPPEEIPAEMLDQIPEEFRPIVDAMLDPESLLNRSFAIATEEIDFDSPAVRAAEIPSSNGIGTARGLAGLYAALLDGRILSPATLADATVEQAAGTDRVLLIPNRFASGFMLPTEGNPLGGPASFGHPGRGGSLAFADPERGIAFAYVVNHIRQNPGEDTRAANLLTALNAAS